MSTPSEPSGIVFNIQRFCLNDGPGIRTTVFLKGCPLRCAWCHNPESNDFAQEIMFAPQKCIGCGKCFAICKNHVMTDGGEHVILRENCTRCGSCAQGCMAGALTVAGKRMTVSEVLSECDSDALFYGADGGVTLSGGEPLAQSEFALAILRGAKEKGYTTAIETSAFCSGGVLRAAAQVTDTFLFDYKETDPDLHRRFTGQDNALILQNLALLDELGAKVVLRCPIVPNYNDREDHFEGIARVADAYKCIDHVEIEPYHDLGRSKAKQLDKEYATKEISTVTQEKAQEWIDSVSRRTAKRVKRG